MLTGSGGGGSDSLPRLVTVSTWWWRHQWLLNEERFLSDVARTVGPDRFLVFWNSSLPVEPSLEAALRTPVGEWTAEWERRFVPRLPLGPTVSWFAGVTGVVLSGLVVLGAMLAAAHRQVR